VPEPTRDSAPTPERLNLALEVETARRREHQTGAVRFPNQTVAILPDHAQLQGAVASEACRLWFGWKALEEMAA
jgi:hypothetical protein